MPTRTILQENDATVAAVGTWTNAAPNYCLAGNATWSNTAGNYRTWTLPANHGYTGGAVIGYGHSAGCPNAQVYVDGVLVHAAWNMKFGNASQPNYFMPRILSWPFALNPAKSTPQTVQVVAGTTGTVTYVDGIELYTAAAQIAGRLTSIGHSMFYAVVNGNSVGPQVPRATGILAGYLGATLYKGTAAWTDDNQCVPSEDLSNGSYKSGTAGGPNAAPAYAQFGNSQYYNNVAIFTPGWMRAEAGDTWPNPAPALGSALFTTNAQYMAGVPQWWARAFSVGIIGHVYNDSSYGAIYDAGGFSIPTAQQDAALETTAPAAGSGYAQARWLQRMRELLIRAQLAITPAPRIYVFGMTNSTNGVQFGPNNSQYKMEQALIAMLQEPWVQNTFMVTPYSAMTGLPCNVSAADPHPNPMGQQILGDMLIRTHDAAERTVPTRT